MKILLTGANGQLGCSIKEIFKEMINGIQLKNNGIFKVHPLNIKLFFGLIEGFSLI